MNPFDDRIPIVNDADPAQERSQSPQKFPQFLVALIATLGGLAAGTVFAWTTAISVAIENAAFSFPIAENQLDLINAWMTIGAGLSSIIIILIKDLFSNKSIALMFAVPFVCGWLSIIYCSSIVVLYAGRFLTGLSSGVFCVTIPMYIAEVAHKSIRGTLTSLMQFMISLGISYACILGAMFEDPIKLAVFCAPIPVVFAALFAFVPQSPIHLLKSGCRADAEKSLRQLRGSCYDLGAELAELDDLIESQANLSREFVLKTFFTNKITRKVLLIVFGLFAFQQLSGINVFLVYMSLIFKEISASIAIDRLEIYFGIVQCVATLIALVTVDLLGRKVLLITSALFMSASCFVVMLFFSYKGLFMVLAKTLAWPGNVFVPVIAIFVYMIMYSIGFGPLLWTIPSEILPLEIKSTGMALASLVCWALATITVEYFTYFKLLIRLEGIFAFFGLCSFCAAIFVYFFVPETKNKSLKDIQEELAN